MNGLNDSINGLNGHVAVAESPATDGGAGQGMTEAKRLELLGQLDSDNLDLFQELIEELERPDVDTEAVKVWFEFESSRRNRAKSRKEAATAAPASEQVEAPTTEQETDPTLIPSVHTIARTVFARMLTNQVGSALFPLGLLDLHLNHDEVGGLYLDIVEGVIAGLAGADMDELRLAGCYGSIR